MNNQFIDIIQLIKQSRSNAFKAVNAELINLYWNVGAHISKRMENASWGENMVDELAIFIHNNHSELKGFGRRGLYRMKQFYEIYSALAFVSPLVTQMQEIENQKNEIGYVSMLQLELSDIRESILTKISWTNHLIIISRTKTDEEREFYLKLCIKEKYSKRELERQISAGLFERTILGNANFSKSLNEIHPDLVNSFRDSYVFEFLNLPEPFNETLQCLVAFELKADKFKPEQIGQLNFYLEALDRDVKKSNENPSIGILLCKDKDREVVEYSMSRSLSPTMIAQYEIHLPDKKLLQQKLHELFEDGNRKM